MPKPPLKRMPINIHTRGRTSYVQLGILSNSSKQKVLPLYGKQTYQRSQRWNYYTTSDGYNLIRIPLSYKGNDCMSETGCDELMDGNSIHIEQYNDDFSVKIPEKIHLSASAIDTYKSCPLKFRLSKLDGIPQNASKPELIFGNIIHSVLQRFHEPKKELSKDRILRLLDEEWKKDDFDYKVREERFKQQGIEILKQYCILVRSQPPNVLKREEK